MLKQKPKRAVWWQVEANKDQSLARRVQRLQRFLLDKLHHESLQRQKGSQLDIAEQPAVPQEEPGADYMNLMCSLYSSINIKAIWL